METIRIFQYQGREEFVAFKFDSSSDYPCTCYMKHSGPKTAYRGFWFNNTINLEVWYYEYRIYGDKRFIEILDKDELIELIVDLL